MRVTAWIWWGRKLSRAINVIYWRMVVLIIEMNGPRYLGLSWISVSKTVWKDRLCLHNIAFRMGFSTGNTTYDPYAMGHRSQPDGSRMQSKIWLACKSHLKNDVIRQYLDEIFSHMKEQALFFKINWRLCILDHKNAENSILERFQLQGTSRI